MASPDIVGQTQTFVKSYISLLQLVMNVNFLGSTHKACSAHSFIRAETVADIGIRL
jgi:hypothetical protein